MKTKLQTKNKLYMENKTSNQDETANSIKHNVSGSMDKTEVPEWWERYKKANPDDKDEYDKRKHCCARFWKDFCDCVR